jgi:hypothetical protein
MLNLPRRAAWIALALALTLAGCSESPQAATRTAPKSQAEAKPAPKPETQAKAVPAADKSTANAEEEAELKANLAKLDPADRKLAEAQRFCAIEDENRLGAMGTPVKLMIEGKPVFICCKGCRKQALAEPEKTLAKVEELKQKAATSTK